MLRVAFYCNLSKDHLCTTQAERVDGLSWFEVKCSLTRIKKKTVLKIWEKSLFHIHEKVFNILYSFVRDVRKIRCYNIMYSFVQCTSSCHVRNAIQNIEMICGQNILKHQNFTARKQMFFWIFPTHHRSLLWGCWLCSIIIDVVGFAIYKQGGICGIWRFACGNYASSSTLMKNKSNVTTRIVCCDVHHMWIVRTFEVEFDQWHGRVTDIQNTYTIHQNMANLCPWFAYN